STRGTVRSLEFAAEGSAAGLLIAAAPPQLLALRPLSPSATEHVEAISPVLIRGEGNDFGVLTSPSWSAVATLESFGTTTTQTTTPGAWRQWEFFGRSISCFGETGPDAPLVNISLDGGPVTTVDLYAPEISQEVPFFETTFPENDWHIVRITHSGMSHPLSSGSTLATDGFATTR
ncbi:MAG: hypothetical protein ACI9EF_002523, partial [Pseudohongiellaceae bacterium]